MSLKDSAIPSSGCFCFVLFCFGVSLGFLYLWGRARDPVATTEIYQGVPVAVETHQTLLKSEEECAHSQTNWSWFMGPLEELSCLCPHQGYLLKFQVNNHRKHRIQF